MTTPVVMSSHLQQHAFLLQGYTAVADPSASSVTLSAATFDPTAALSDVVGSVMGTPLIMAVPVMAALGLASQIAWLLVAYASPAL
jgi:hypothetical protein